MMLDWLMVQHEVKDPNNRLKDTVVSRLRCTFVTEVQKARGKKNPLTAAGLRSLREEYTRTIEPPGCWPPRRCNWNTGCSLFGCNGLVVVSA